MDAVVFDMDGTLVDSEGVHAEALMEVLTPWGIRVGQEDCVGLADEAVIVTMLERAGVALGAGDVRGLVERKADVMAAWLGGGRARAYEGAAAAVASAGRRARTGACSAASEREMRASLGAIGVLGMMECLVARDHVVHTKPDPACYALICEQMGVENRRTVAVEDSVAGVTAARGAGLRVVAVGHTTARTELGDVDAYIETIAQLDIALERLA